MSPAPAQPAAAAAAIINPASATGPRPSRANHREPDERVERGGRVIAVLLEGSTQAHEGLRKVVGVSAPGQIEEGKPQVLEARVERRLVARDAHHGAQVI